jgi:hypothetical protein
MPSGLPGKEMLYLFRPRKIIASGFVAARKLKGQKRTKMNLTGVAFVSNLTILRNKP